MTFVKLSENLMRIDLPILPSLRKQRHRAVWIWAAGWEVNRGGCAALFGQSGVSWDSWDISVGIYQKVYFRE